MIGIEGIIMKVYQCKYDNGECWSDHFAWTGDAIYVYRSDAEKEIISKGYKKFLNEIGELRYVEFTPIEEDDDYGSWASIHEYELIGLESDDT